MQRAHVPINTHHRQKLSAITATSMDTSLQSVYINKEATLQTKLSKVGQDAKNCQATL
ncbi:unnamed protein product, partial [Ceratitis capitata]